MPKKKEKTPDEWYRGKIRELEKEARQLRQRLKQSEKFKCQEENEATDSEDTHPKITKLALCQDCGKGHIIQKNIIGYIFEECDVCDYRRKVT